MTIPPIIHLLFFPGGLFMLALALAYEYVDRKVVARFQNRIGPRWFQPAADVLKLLIKEEVTPNVTHPVLFVALPVLALAGSLTAALSVPILGLNPALSFPGDLIVTVYLLSLVTMSMGLAGWNTNNRFSLIGATRSLTQVFCYEAPFMLALLGPAVVTGSWRITEILQTLDGQWIVFSQPIGFLVAVVGLMGKLEMPPFDAPKAKTEIVAGAMTEYSGRGLGLFHLGKIVEEVVGLTLLAALYLGGVSNPLAFFGKTLALLVVMAACHCLFTRLRIDQTVGVWWRYGTVLVLLQWIAVILWRVMTA